MLVTIKRLVQHTLAACNSAIKALPPLVVQSDETTILTLPDELMSSKQSHLFVVGDDELRKEMCDALMQYSGPAGIKLCHPTGDTNGDINLMHSCVAIVVGLESGTFSDAHVVSLLHEAMS